jgi:predicted phosphodiesterase
MNFPLPALRRVGTACEGDHLSQPRDNRPLLVFGGPYSNLRATEAVIAEAARRDVPPCNVVCTGDVVAYCAEPEETARRIKAWGCHTIQGNCEESFAAGAADCGCNFEEGTACDLLAKGWYPFADAELSAETRAWMGGLPRTLRFTYQGRRIRVVHGGTDEIARWVFASDRVTIVAELAAAEADIVLAGHCGLPFIARAGGKVWLNAGVIGMPANDGTADVWYALIEPAGGNALTLSLHRLAYDHLGAAAALRRLRFADSYARTLVDGLWPSMDVLPETERARQGIRLRPRGVVIGEAGRPDRAAAE